MKTFTAAATLAAALAAPWLAWGHEGHAHDDAPPAVQALASRSPRFEAQTDDLEVVGVLEAGELTLYIDRRLTNEPLAGAQVEVEGAGVTGTATESAPATYRLPFAMPAAGRHPLALTVQAGDLADLVAAELDIAPPSGAPALAPAASGTPPWLPWSLGGALALVGVSVIARRGLRRQGRKD
ncbi:hypothetical protein [Azoarcus sp. KH32C]|uniref:hypothetical protein n=1 Tax=Azoarcus sp. KH32C TaxID=748247 RepID=UPI0002386098|nr:hypothetical protein [Azoarcus sp. KH32C]BAL26750.1 hypothetical protein AZKH_4477 [Azoarcus sp. KH32C]